MLVDVHAPGRHRLLDRRPHEPRQISPRAGSNDLCSGRTPEQVTGDFAEFVRTVRERLPRTEILYVSAHPIPSRRGESDTCRDLYRRIRGLAAGLPRVGLVDAFDVSVDRDGRPRSDPFRADRLHFNDKGNDVFGDRTRPHLTATKEARSGERVAVIAPSAGWVQIRWDGGRFVRYTRA